MTTRSVLALLETLASSAVPSRRNDSLPWIILAILVSVYALFILAWRWLLRRWNLTGPAAPSRDALGHREYLARRSLRALLAFDFLVMLPIGIPSSAAILYMAVSNPGKTDPGMVIGALGILMFIVPIPVLHRSIKRMEAQRLAGLPVETQAQALSTGVPALDTHMRSRPWATILAALAISGVSVASWVAPEGQLQALLTKDNSAILAGQWWRLVTVGLVHANPQHLFFNIMVLGSMGSTFERLAGARRMLIVLVAGVFAGALLSVGFLPQPSVGASGGALALAAAVVLFGLRHRRLFPTTARARLFKAALELVGLNAVLTFVLPNVDWAAHAGGLAAGALLGWFSEPTSTTLAAMTAGVLHGSGAPPPSIGRS